jgi:hypothetical protein
MINVDLSHTLVIQVKDSLIALVPPPCTYTADGVLKNCDKSVVWNGGVTVAMINVDLSHTLVIQVKDSLIALVPPPHTQLAVPCAGQHVEQVLVLQRHQAVEVLVA